ncbi:MAG: oligosaccharide flippase family protein [Pseudomonadota bacterium]
MTASETADPRDAAFATAHDPARHGARVGTASVAVLALSALKTLLLFGGIMITARLIPPAEFSVFALAMAALMIALKLSNFGLPQAILQRPDMTHGAATAIFWTNVGFAGLGAVLVAGLGPPAAVLFGNPRVAPVFAALALNVVLAALIGQFGAVLQRRLETARLARHETLAEALGLGAAIAAALAGWSYWALVLQQVVMSLVLVGLTARSAGWRPSPPWRADFRDVRGTLGFGGALAGAALAQRLTLDMGTLIAGARLGDMATGLFQRAARIGSLPAERVTVPLAATFTWSLARLQDAPTDLRQSYVRLASRTALVMFPIGVLMAVASAPLTAVLLGPDWAGAAPLLMLFSLMVVHAGIFDGLRALLISTGRTDVLLVHGLLRLALVTTALLLASDAGLVPMAAAFMAVDLLVALPLALALTLRATPLYLRDVVRALGPALLVAIALAAMLKLLVAPALEPLPAVAEVAILGALTLAGFAAFAASSAALRHDLGRVAALVVAQLRRGRTAAQQGDFS